MMSLQQNTLQFNTKFSFDFSGGNLSSDSGLLFIKEFIHKIGFDNLLKQYFGTDNRKTHSISSIIEQLIYQNIAGSLVIIEMMLQIIYDMILCLQQC